MISSKITQALRVMDSSTNPSNHSLIHQLDTKKSWLTFGDNNEYQLSIANDRATKKKAYQLVYNSYIEKEYAETHSSEMWYSLYDAHPDTITFVVKKLNNVVGTSTVIFDSLLGLPCEDLFKNNVDQFRSKLSYLAEVVSLAIDEKERGATQILTKLFNTVIRYSQSIKGATDFLITINPRHSFFYIKKLLFTELSDTKAFNKVGGAPAVLLHLDLITAQRITKYKHLKKYKRTLYPNFLLAELESGIFEYLQSQQVSICKSDFNYFFKIKRKLYTKTSNQNKNYLNEYYSFLNMSKKSFIKTFKKLVS